MFHAHPPMAASLFIAIYLYEPSDGGLDRVAILFANHLVQRGVRAELWMARTEGPVARLIDPAVTVRRVPSPPLERRLAMIAQFPGLAVMVRRHGPDVLYSAGNQSNMLVALAALGTGTRAVGRISNPLIRPGQKRLAAHFRLRRFRAIARASAMTIVMGEADRRLLTAAGPLAATDVRLLPRPSVTPAMDAAFAARKPRQPGDPCRLLMVGRLAVQKDHATALRAVARLPHLDWRLQIAGDGPLRDELIQLCGALGISDRVAFPGFIADPQHVAALMGQADLLLQPSRWEGLAGTVIEALGCGAGVVATDSTPNIRPLLQAAGQHDPVPVGDDAAFARAVEWALGHPAPLPQLASATAPYRLADALDGYAGACRSLAGNRPHRFRESSLIRP
ncbi:glycosyltransferase involved in cell wall biosynthesis [Sphingobium wenxiniae]|uniref:Glycosyltransferase subfamily 4-like N-terminal domain-containing protein n=2 Tax=Sphingobium TaxID=165695 RepID=T0GE65_9SPHN|nr:MULTISPECIES: glycosyltransferase [Sphingobium]EQA98976.1 hypothetical protein L485_15580 [Sphingobium baderi LL03]KMS61213.1 glycosyl transferase family 1 [Sphingobium baderi LL03]MBB6191846.1 glycosyltransferase involved in cell wall biosynthesis [Sphingobium wenxiniae]TWH96879.1 glycosyltransferase involved in cell wall biosynthesis [Sphingobium wenxiniae]WRD75124.1 glycosyltransferase [Sphingobium baderi]